MVAKMLKREQQPTFRWKRATRQVFLHKIEERSGWRRLCVQLPGLSNRKGFVSRMLYVALNLSVGEWSVSDAAQSSTCCHGTSRLHHSVSVSTLFTQPRAFGPRCVNPVETSPRDITFTYRLYQTIITQSSCYDMTYDITRSRAIAFY